MANDILAGIKSEFTVDFCFVKNMESSSDKSEVIEINVLKIERLFKIFTIYSPPNNKPNFSFLNSSSHTIFLEDFNAHSPMWGCNDSNEARKSVEDLLNPSTFELIYNSNDPHTCLHYNGTSTTPDLLLLSSDVSDLTKRSVLDDPGSDHRQIIADISFGSPSK